MKQGEKLGPNVERRVAELAKTYLHWSQQQIADKIFRELHIHIHRSTVGRCLQWAGIRRQMPRQLERRESQDATKEEQSSKEHTEALRSLVRNWQEQCQVHPLSEAIRQLAIPRMVDDLFVQETEDGEATKLYPISTIPDSEDRPSLVKMPIEKDELFLNLREHLEPTPVLQEYARWQGEASKYFLRLGLFFHTAAAVNESDERLLSQYPQFEKAQMLVPLVLTCDLLAFGLRELPSQRWSRD